MPCSAACPPDVTRQVEARDGPAAALSRLRQLCADPEARPGLLLGDPALAAWLARAALAAGEGELAARAARMYISTHPVAHHLRQAFRKLSIASRVELTRIVIEQAADGS
jgi:DNA-binding CsgD family transcriptional regulator